MTIVINEKSRFLIYNNQQKTVRSSRFAEDDNKEASLTEDDNEVPRMQSIRGIYKNVIPNLFRNRKINETLKQVQGDDPEGRGILIIKKTGYRANPVYS